MKNKIKKLPETELELMLCLWDAGKSVQRNYFNTQLRDKGWSDSTVLTMLARLQEKGLTSTGLIVLTRKRCGIFF